jgi:catechol-2,3-dioxygenase
MSHAARPADPALPVPAKLAHVVFRTTRYAEMCAWYRTVLNARAVFENPFLTFLTYDDEHHRIAIAAMPGAETPPPMAAGVDHVAFTYAALGDLLATYVRLRDAGIRPVWCVNHGPTTSLYYADPDGNRIELQIDNFPDEETLMGWFRTGAFEANPIGVNFDPERLLARFRAGEPLALLVRQDAAPVA